MMLTIIMVILSEAKDLCRRCLSALSVVSLPNSAFSVLRYEFSVVQ
jgi:hypothetical protein